MILKENYYGKCRKKIKEFERKVQIFFGGSGTKDKINSESLIRLSNLYNVSPEYILYGINKDSSNLESSIISFFNNENIDFKEKEELFNKIQNAFFKEKFK